MNNFGPFQMSVQSLRLYDNNFIQEIIRYANSIDGFLCNMQIPIMFDMATRFSGKWVEVGCWKGRTTAAIVNSNNPRNTYYCVDTFLGSEEHQDVLKGGSTKSDFLSTINNIPSKSQISILEMTSVEASKLFESNSLDVVFIDAAHDYENVVLDIQAWHPKLKSNGILIGHDYPDPNDPNGGFEELKKAVNMFVRDSSLFYDFGYVAGLWGAFKK